MAGTLKMCRYDGLVAQTAEEAIKILYESDHRSVILYSSRMDKLRDMCDEVYEEITKRNKDIPDVKDQMLPTEPYIWDDIDGCLAVKCAEIGMDVFDKSAECLHIFTRPKYSCLTDPSARKPLSPKALTSIALFGSFLTKGDN